MSTAEQLYFASVSLKKILFAMDFSPGSLLAFPFAVSIARHYGSKIFVAHITPTEDYDAAPSARQAEDAEASMEESLSSSIGKLQDIPHELLYDHGSICSKLLAAANNQGVDLIVIGTHGWRGIKKLLRGSTAEEISCLATKPVLTAGPNVSRTPDFKRILYATDFSPAAQRALPLALSLTQSYNASLLFLHINDWTSKEPPIDAKRKTVKFFHEQLFQYGYDKAIGDKSEVIVDFGPRAELILELASTRKADLIVMGAHSGTGIKARIAAHLPGSLPYDVTSQSPCPVLTVPVAKNGS
jgi:nucleotide-binding universal stress UspA family protein